MTVFILYHSNCIDGSGARYAAWKKYKDQATYIAVQYNQPLPEVLQVTDGSLEDAEVYILDFSYSRDILFDLRGRVKKLVILDHHLTAKNDLKDFPLAIFDMLKSGAVLAHEYFFPEERVPQILLHVQDRDLWLFRMPDTKAICAYLTLYKENIETWRAFDILFHGTCEYAIPSGNDILTYMDAEVARNLRKVKVINYKGYRVGFMNLTTLISETGSAICESKELNVDISATYFVTDQGKAVISFRSRNDIDVSALAKELGGGGHAQACGATVSLAFISSLYLQSVE